MKQITRKITKIVLPLLAVLMPGIVFADQVSTGLQGSGIKSYFGFGGINSATSVTQLIGQIIKLLLTIGGAIAVLFVIIGGYWYITSAGNEEQAEKGKNTLVNAIIGVVLITLAYVIINVIVNQVSSGTIF